MSRKVQGRKRKKQYSRKKAVKEVDLLHTRFEDDVIREKRAFIHRTMIETSRNIIKDNFDIIAPADLELMFSLYNAAFFGGYFTRSAPGMVDFRVSSRMTRTGGKTTKHLANGRYTITLSGTLLFQSFREESREVQVNGMVCTDRLDAAMRVMEHEMVHLLEFIVFDSSRCSGARFRDLVNNLFGHTETKHRLVTGYETARVVHHLEPGNRVRFRYREVSLEGVITRITKRATVMVENRKGNFRGKDEKRYQKFYVPLHFLEPVREKGKADMSLDMFTS